MSATLFAPLVARARGPAAAMLSLSSDDAVQYILSDVPFFTVGILAFGVLTFFIVLKRLTRVILCLHVSVFFCFSASIFDLIQVLLRNGNTSTAVEDTNPVLGLIITREILFAISAATRLLFFWGFVACPPHGEPRVLKRKLHSGSWQRWGIFGMLLQWSLLAAIFAVLTLQILYRVFTPLHHYGLVYQVEGILQIAILSVFILKLLMNSYLVDLDSTRSRAGMMAAARYTPVISALAINIGIEVGNILQFLFTETVLGRFLQAIEIYVLILYVLISSFIILRRKLSAPSLVKRSSSFRGLPPVGFGESSFDIPPPRVSTPDLASAMQSRSMDMEGSVREERRASGPAPPSSMSRISTWLNPRRVSQKFMGRPSSPGMARDRLWNQDEAENEAEKGVYQVDFDPFSADPRKQSFDQSPTEPKETPKYQDPVYTSVMRESALTRNVLASTSTPPMELSIPQPLQPLQPRLSVIVPDPLPTPGSSNGQTDSPIYGLNGIVRSLKPRASSPERAEEPIEDPRTYFDAGTPRSSGMVRSSGISGLLRQQDELDKSIAALKLFNSEIPEAASRKSSSSALETPKPPSASQSEFSLSNFPEPPWRRSFDAGPSTPPEVPMEPVPRSAERATEIVATDVEVRSQVPSVGMMSMLAAQGTSSPQPLSYGGPEELPRSSMDNAGSRYVITSFIDNLTQPELEASNNIPADASRRMSMAPSVRQSRASFLRPIAEASPPRTVTALPPAAVIRSSTSVDAPRIKQPRKLPTPPPRAVSARIGRLSPGPASFAGPGNRPVGLPSRPRLTADRRQSVLLDRNGVFERPRPAPGVPTVKRT